MKEHRKWTALFSYFEQPIDKEVKEIRKLLDEGKNVLLFVKKKEGITSKDQQEKFNDICQRFPEETLEHSKGLRIIVSSVVDVNEIVEIK